MRKRKAKKDAPVMLVTDRLVGFSKDTPNVIDPNHPVDYTKQEVPPNYKCGKCGATGCKLWREYQTFPEHQMLRCANCAAKDQKRNISDIDAHGQYHDPDDVFPTRRTDQIGWYVPAVPTEENDSYWGYTWVPQAGCDWWNRLPTLPS